MVVTRGLTIALLCLFSFGCSSETNNENDAGSKTDTSDMAPNSDTAKSNDLNADTTTDLSQGCDPCDYIPETTFDETTELMGLTVTSEAGGRELPLLVRLPTGATGELPVVVWAHGGSWGSNKHTIHAAWSESFARAGYVVVHFSMVRPTVDELRSICMTAGVTDPADCEDLSVSGMGEEEDPENNPFQSITIARAEDPKAVLDALPRISTRLSENGITLDLSSVSIAGWSGGSQSVLQLAGAVRTISDKLPPYESKSPIPSSFVALSPQGPGFSKFFEESWADVRGPTIVLTGAKDVKDANALTGPVRRRAYELMAAGDKRLFYSTDEGPGIVHGSFNLEGRANGDPRIAGLARALQSSVIAFVDCHTRGRTQACDWIASDAASQIVDGLVEQETK